jgi:small subunit ribosomal protein S3
VGHKVHPTGFRIGVIRDWQSKWYTDTHYAEFVREDLKLREEIRKKYREAAISLIEIDRQAKDVTITLYTARPGIVIGRGGQRVDEMRLYLENLIGKRIRLNIQEVRQPELDAYLVARNVAEQIERRIAYRRAMKQTLLRTIQAGAKGIKISCAGRLGNAEIARRQTSHEGQVPLHTLRADIDYGFTEAHTTLGRIGVKVWIYKGEILPEPKYIETEDKAPEAEIEEIVTAAPVEEAAVEPVEAIAESAEPAPVAEAAEKEAKPRARKTTKVTEDTESAPAGEPTEKPVGTTAEGAEAAPEAEKKTIRSRAKTVPKTEDAVEAEDTAAKPAVRKSRKAPVAKTETDAGEPAPSPEATLNEEQPITEEEAKDAAA